MLLRKETSTLLSFFFASAPCTFDQPPCTCEQPPCNFDAKNPSSLLYYLLLLLEFFWRNNNLPQQTIACTICHAFFLLCYVSSNLFLRGCCLERNSGLIGSFVAVVAVVDVASATCTVLQKTKIKNNLSSSSVHFFLSISNSGVLSASVESNHSHCRSLDFCRRRDGFVGL